MTIRSEDINFKEYEYKINLSGPGGLVIDRRFALQNGESVTIHVELNGSEPDLAKINDQSIQRAIEILQAFLPEE